MATATLVPVGPYRSALELADGSECSRERRGRCTGSCRMGGWRSELRAVCRRGLRRVHYRCGLRGMPSAAAWLRENQPWSTRLERNLLLGTCSFELAGDTLGEHRSLRRLNGFYRNVSQEMGKKNGRPQYRVRAMTTCWCGGRRLNGTLSWSILSSSILSRPVDPEPSASEPARGFSSALQRAPLCR